MARLETGTYSLTAPSLTWGLHILPLPDQREQGLARIASKSNLVSRIVRNRHDIS
jgi:hypothetical protein